MSRPRAAQPLQARRQQLQEQPRVLRRRRARVSDSSHGSGTWKTILVGGLNNGGKGYYALDVTDPLAPKGMWEFKWSDTCYDAASASTAGADCHLGKSFGRPLISKLADGPGWCMVTSGYNNVNATAQGRRRQGLPVRPERRHGQIIYKIATERRRRDHAQRAGADQQLRRQGGDRQHDAARLRHRRAAATSGASTSTTTRRRPDARRPSSAPQRKRAACLSRSPMRPELTQLGGKPMVFVATGKLLGATGHDRRAGAVDLRHRRSGDRLAPPSRTCARPSRRWR